jgi:NAD(P)-dependent dehydrogenase (short-subunit alcohol dehydrogenase family)
MEQLDLKGKVAIVTGSATGIGAAVALGLARRAPALSSTTPRARPKRARRPNWRGKPARMSSLCKAMWHATRIAGRSPPRRWRPGAASTSSSTMPERRNSQHMAIWTRLSAEDFTSIYAVNVIGPFQMIRACAKALKDSGAGAVVNVSSIAGGGRRFVGRLCRVEGCAQHHDLVAGARARGPRFASTRSARAMSPRDGSRIDSAPKRSTESVPNRRRSRR